MSILQESGSKKKRDGEREDQLVEKKERKKMTLEVKGQEMKNAYIHPGSMCTKFY